MGLRLPSLPGALAKYLPTALTLPVALGVSFVLHGAVLSLHFKFPEASRALQDKALDIILVNSKSARRPTHAQALAQANLDGGGNVEENRRAATPLPPSARQQAGSDLEQSRQRVRDMEAQQQRLLTEVKSKTRAPRQDSRESQPQNAPTLSGRDLASSAMAMARMEAEISKSVDEYNQRPRKKNIGTRADEYRFARYVEDWRLKVERVGTLNYPEAARAASTAPWCCPSPSMPTVPWTRWSWSAPPATRCWMRRPCASCAWPAPMRPSPRTSGGTWISW